MRNDDALNKLREHLIGKTVVAVHEADRDESLFRIETSDGFCVRVSATDLGFWVNMTNTPNSEKFVFPDLESLMTEYIGRDFHFGPSFDQPPSFESYYGGIFRFRAVDSTLFSLDTNSLTDNQRSILSDPDGRSMFLKAIVWGHFFNSAWDPEKNVDADLRFRWEDPA